MSERKSFDVYAFTLKAIVQTTIWATMAAAEVAIGRAVLIHLGWW